MQVIFVLMACWLSPALAAIKPVAVVRTVTGQAFIRSKGKTQFAAARRQSLFPGDIVGTGKRGKITLLFNDGAQVRLHEDSAINITAPTPVGNGKVSLFRALSGDVWARLRPGNAVQTRTVALGVRGTEIHLSVAPDDGTTTVTVVEGEVELWNEFGKAVVGTSQQSVTRPGAAPSAPITVQNAGLIIEWTLDLDRAAIPHEKFFISLDKQVVATELSRRMAQAQAQPDSEIARRNLGDALFDSRRFDEARREYEAALRLTPRQPLTLTRLGYTFVELDLLDEAEAAFRAAGAAATIGIAQNSAVATPQLIADEGQPAALGVKSYAPALVGMAWLDLIRERPAQAEAAAQQALASEATAKTVATNAANDESTSAEARIALGVARLRQPGEAESALAPLLEASTSEPAHYRYQAHAWLGLAYLAQNQLDKALFQARLATQMEPHSGLAQGNLALVYFFNGQPNAARRAGLQAVALNPDSVAARVALGQAELAQGDVDAAATTAAQAVALDPQLSQARYLLGVANASRRDLSHAELELKESLRLTPDFLPAASALARVYNGMGRAREAVGVIEALPPRQRQSDAALGALGEVFYEQGNYDKAAQSYSQALQKMPRSALYHADLARSLIYGNRLDQAIQAAQTAVRLAPEVGQYHAILGLAYQFSAVNDNTNSSERSVGLLPGRFSGLGAQAEREFRTALTLDPQNALALAQLAFKHSGADLRPALSSFTQSFLHDPAVARQLLRGGVGFELTPVAGDSGRSGVDFTHRNTASDGKFHAFGFLNRAGDGGDLANTGRRNLSLSEFITYVPAPRTNVFLSLNHTRSRLGLGGSTLNPDNDDHSRFRFGDAQLAVRQRVGAGRSLWLGVRGNTSRSDAFDPDLDSFTDATGGFPGGTLLLPVRGQRFNTRAIVPELRFDAALNPSTQNSGVLTFGAAYASTSFDQRRNLLVPLGSGDGRSTFSEDAGTWLAYGQLAQRLGRRLSLIGQLRAQRIDRDRLSTLSLPGRDLISVASSPSRTYLLPSFLASYQADQRTTLRFSMNQRVTDVTASNFAPNETLLTTRSGALPYGTPELQHLAQLEAERYIGPKDFVKVFVFRSSASNVQIGGPDFIGFGGGLPAANAPFLRLANWKGSGAGARYERQMGRHLFASFDFTLRRTSADAFSSAPYEPKRVGALELNHISAGGTKIGVRLRHVGSFFQDDPLIAGRPVFPSANYVDLLLARAPSTRSELFFSVTNVFNRAQAQFNGFATGRRAIRLGATQRF